MKDEYIEVTITYNILCQSDISLITENPMNTKSPFFNGYKAIGYVSKIGKNSKDIQLSQIVGICTDFSCDSFPKKIRILSN